MKLWPQIASSPGSTQISMLDISWKSLGTRLATEGTEKGGRIIVSQVSSEQIAIADIIKQLYRLLKLSTEWRILHPGFYLEIFSFLNNIEIP